MHQEVGEATTPHPHSKAEGHHPPGNEALLGGQWPCGRDTASQDTWRG